MIKQAISNQLASSRKRPEKPKEVAIMPMMDMIKAKAIWAIDPWSSKAGFTRKKKGMNKDVPARRTAVKPVRMGLDPAMPAATNAVSQTGGVIRAATP